MQHSTQPLEARLARLEHRFERLLLTGIPAVHDGPEVRRAVLALGLVWPDFRAAFTYETGADERPFVRCISCGVTAKVADLEERDFPHGPGCPWGIS